MSEVRMGIPSPAAIEELNATVDALIASREENVYHSPFGGYSHGLPPRYMSLIGIGEDIVDASRRIPFANTQRAVVFKNPDGELGSDLEVTASNWVHNPRYDNDRTVVPEVLQGSTFRTLEIEVPHRHRTQFDSDDEVARLRMERYASEHFRDIVALPAPRERLTVLNRFLYVSLGEKAVLEAYTHPIVTWTGEVKNSQGHQWETNVGGEKYETHTRLLPLTEERAGLVSKVALKYLGVKSTRPEVEEDETRGGDDIAGLLIGGGGPVLVTEVGAAIFGNHIRAMQERGTAAYFPLDDNNTSE